MIYAVIFDEHFTIDVELHRKAGRLELVNKIKILIDELENHPRMGTGKPERLKYYKGEVWSRRIDYRHRLIYEIRNQELIVIAISAYGHYDEKL
jgi:toxin YoeB